jgi:hypothetical protein
VLRLPQSGTLAGAVRNFLPAAEDAPTAIANGLYELWDAEMAVQNLQTLLSDYPMIREVHF